MVDWTIHRFPRQRSLSGPGGTLCFSQRIGNGLTLRIVSAIVAFGFLSLPSELRCEPPNGNRRPDSSPPVAPSKASEATVDEGARNTRTKVSGGGILDLAGRFPRAEHYEVERNVVFHEQGNEPLKADLYRPTMLSESAQRWPAVLMIHGGAWISGDKIQVAWHASRLAERGYFVMAINYRLAPHHRFPAQLQDCHEAMDWLYAEADRLRVDRDRIAGYGYSAGGHLICLLGLKLAQEQQMRGNPSGDDPTKAQRQAGQPLDGESQGENFAEPGGADKRFCAIVAGGVPCDFERLPPDSERLAFWLGGTRRQLPAVYRAACPLNFVSAGAPPMFLFHGSADRIVSHLGAERMKSELQQRGVAADWYLLPQAGHLEAYLDQEAFERSANFLDRHLHPNRPE